MHSQKKKIVTKFGGSSLANAEQFRKVKDRNAPQTHGG